jgi:TetR/AcrR family transcriptional regulator
MAGRRDSRSLIAAAARAEFSEHGYSGGRVDRIARRAGVNKQLIFYYFGSKAALYQSVVERAVGEAVPPSAHRGVNSAAELRQTFATLFDALEEQPELTRLIILDSQRLGSEQPVSQGPIRAFQMRIRDLVAAGQGVGHYRDNVDPDQVARQAVVLALGYFALRPLLDGPPVPGRAVQWRDGAVDVLLRGLSW